jgi:hypothetical protein
MSFWLQEDQKAMVSKFKGDKPNLKSFEKYSVANLSTSRPKGKGEEGYLYSNWGYVRFVGDAHKYIQSHHVKDGDLLVLNKAVVSKEPYEKDGKTVYPTSEQILVLDCVLSRKAAKGKTEEDIEDENEEAELPPEDDIPF